MCGAAQVDTEVGRPRVNYHEAITRRAEFDYLHKKQSGARLLPCPPALFSFLCCPPAACMMLTRLCGSCEPRHVLRACERCADTRGTLGFCALP
jgi:hypothetical protein